MATLSLGGKQLLRIEGPKNTEELKKSEEKVYHARKKDILPLCALFMCFFAFMCFVFYGIGHESGRADEKLATRQFVSTNGGRVVFTTDDYKGFPGPWHPDMTAYYNVDKNTIARK